jgi:uncharacterized protein (TIGR02246 family)
MSATNKEIVKKIDEAFAAGNMEGFLAFCADDVEWTMVGDKTVKGKDAIRQWLAAMDMEPPQVTATHLIAEGDSVAAYGHMTMQDKDGQTTPYAYCDIYRFRDAHIVVMASFVMPTKAQPGSGA